MVWTYLEDVEHDMLMNGYEEKCEACGEPLELRYIGVKEWVFYCQACMHHSIKLPIDIKNGDIHK